MCIRDRYQRRVHGYKLIQGSYNFSELLNAFQVEILNKVMVHKLPLGLLLKSVGKKQLLTLEEVAKNRFIHLHAKNEEQIKKKLIDHIKRNTIKAVSYTHLTLPTKRIV
eukprot:TRINITY_DN21704_c0_g1_i1.p1 TRINITY_DN21704_c0_g1~~TRINITY_DN21704_c0_g1_i1.p1  ORF type:complete len:109 (+),score=22.66 TRINITY_DN21704_c0_g1_i1:80-406(+)